MHFSHRIFLVVFLATLFTLSAGVEHSDEMHAIENIKKKLIHEDLLRNHGENQTNSSFIPNTLVGQIISILNCGPFPNQPNSYLQYSLDYTTKSLTLFQACARYFTSTKKSDSLQVQCKYKKWIFNKINCQKTICPPLTAPSGGYISTDDNTYNTTVYFWCALGFDINGTDHVICEENGHWNLPPPTCQVSLCRPLSSPRYGFVSSQEEIAVNQTVKFKCESGYSLIGDAVLRCENDGRWNTSSPVCKKMCIVPNIENKLEAIALVPNFKSLSIGSLVHLSQRIIFSCKPGYKVSSGLSTCIGGFWKPPIHCRKLCTAINVKNGKYIWSKDSSSVEYSCQSGYQLVGHRKLSCTSNLTWDNEAPICTKICTLPKEHDLLSFRNITTYEIIPFGTQIMNGTRVYFQCRHNTSEIVTECINGKIKPYLCVSNGLHNGKLTFFFNGNWCPICEVNFNICEVFGSNNLSDEDCMNCCRLDENIFRAEEKVVLSAPYTVWLNSCVFCKIPTYRWIPHF